MSESEIQRRLRHVRLGVYLLTALAVLGILAAILGYDDPDGVTGTLIRTLPID